MVCRRPDGARWIAPEKSAERKVLIANNKAWNAAEKVRRELIATFLTRKTLPKDADRIIALGLPRTGSRCPPG
ncbi:hypothetical protein C5C21_14350 [Rathayibacter tritici]|nr:hypothetical protein C5C21_14350 [Rathayibacter tritici]